MNISIGEEKLLSDEKLKAIFDKMFRKLFNQIFI